VHVLLLHVLLVDVLLVDVLLVDVLLVDVLLMNFYIIFFAFLAIVLYFWVPFLIVIYSRARIYAAIIPFLFMLHVFFEQIGNDLFGPRKHFLPHFFIITVLWCAPGFCLDQPFTLLFIIYCIDIK